MAAKKVGEFHARDAEGRIYPVHEYHEDAPQTPGSEATPPTVTFRLAIGDRVKQLDQDTFLLVQNEVKLTREPLTKPVTSQNLPDSGATHNEPA